MEILFLLPMALPALRIIVSQNSNEYRLSHGAFPYCFA
jgi:hypothetical protein